MTELLVVPVDQYPWIKVFPVAIGNDLIRQATHGVTLSQIRGGDLALLAALSVAYPVAGLVAFRAMERTARARGVLAVH